MLCFDLIEILLLLLENYGWRDRLHDSGFKHKYGSNPMKRSTIGLYTVE
jgi:hypothetical protein